MTVLLSEMKWTERCCLAIYDVLMQALQPLFRRKLYRRAQHEAEYGLNVAQRFGQYTDHTSGADYVWLHAVSLGETRAAALLLPALRDAFPGMRLLLTHGTATGWAQGQMLLKQGDVQAWLPWDTAQATRQFLMHFKPRVGLIMETEVWPNLVNACQYARVPLCLLNARMSEKSWLEAMRWRCLSKPAYGRFSLVLAQSVADARRLQQLGCTSVQVVGNLKFDVTVSEQARALAHLWENRFSDRPVVMLASFREGEEALWLHALLSRPERLQRLQARGVLWLLVPRHPQRFDEVQALVQQAGLCCERRSAWHDEHPRDDTDFAAVDVVLGDSLGEMQAYYLSSHMALLGGSFAPLGGQNLIEAAACGCPVIMGPHTFNFSEAAALSLDVGAAVQVPDMQEALNRVDLALTDAQWLAQAQTGTVELMRKGRGAVNLHIQSLKTMAALHFHGRSHET